MKLIIMFGFTGSGKSFIAEILKEILKNSIIIKSDVIRKELFHIKPEKKVIVPYESGIYSKESSFKVYRKMLEIAEENLRNKKTVIIDASFLNKKYRDMARNLACSMKVPFVIVAPCTREKTIKKRLENRKMDVSDGRWEIYKRQKENYDKIQDNEKKFTIYLNTEKENIKEFLKRKIQKVCLRTQ